ncbi:MAG: hypothetical protein WBW93_18605, partial [Steroidobacteraceae bacterium]
PPASQTEENKTLEISPPEEDGREENLDVQTGRFTRKPTRRSQTALSQSRSPSPPSAILASLAGPMM